MDTTAAREQLRNFAKKAGRTDMDVDAMTDAEVANAVRYLATSRSTARFLTVAERLAIGAASESLEVARVKAAPSA